MHYTLITNDHSVKKSVLSQGEPRDATAEIVSVKRRITQFITQWVRSSKQPGQQHQMSDDRTCWDCVTQQPGDDDWRNADADSRVDRSLLPPSPRQH